jgi:hypothetical protein
MGQGGRPVTDNISYEDVVSAALVKVPCLSPEQPLVSRNADTPKIRLSCPQAQVWDRSLLGRKSGSMSTNVESCLRESKCQRLTATNTLECG